MHPVRGGHFDQRILRVLPQTERAFGQTKHIWVRLETCWTYEGDGYHVRYYTEYPHDGDGLLIFDCGQFTTDLKFNGLDPSKFLEFCLAQMKEAAGHE